MTEALYHQEIQKSKVKTLKRHQKITTIADLLMIVSWSNESEPTGVVNRFTGA